jgi:hypothetical protein
VYNKSTANGMITIRTHVDDLKVLCKVWDEIQRVINELRKIYKDITVHEGDEHDYLGMIMTQNREQGSVKMNMEKYIEGTIETFLIKEPDEKLKHVTTPATNNLFRTRDGENSRVSVKRAAVFHATVAKLLCVAKRARPVILLTISFLTTRVKQPDTDNWNKLVRVLSYLKGTVSLCLAIMCTNITNLVW